MIKYRILILFLLLASATSLAQSTLTLQECREQALKANHDIRIAAEKSAMADDIKKVAASQFFPRATANGTCLWNSRNMQLLSDEQRNRINHAGSNAMDDLVNNTLADLFARIAQFDPSLAEQLEQNLLESNLANYLNTQGQTITQAFDMDLTAIYAGAVTLTQPIYMGGKIRAAYRTARLYSEIAHIKYDHAREEQLIAVDETYWKVVSLQHKHQLAQQYCNLLRKLSRDVEAMVEAEVATPADMTKVLVKLNEAEMSLTKAENGLILCRMMLNQICGFPLDRQYSLAEDTLMLYQPVDTIDMQQVVENRSELKMLRLGEGIADQGVKLAASALLPNIVATGGYAVSNPNFFNGYDQSFGGSLVAGVAVNVPLCHPGAIFATKAAKHKRNMVRLQLEQAEQKVELQVNKLNSELAVANRKLIQARTTLQNAEENLRNATEGFAAGIISSGDLMQAQTAWMSARSKLIDSEIEVRMGYTYLMQALGR